MEKEGKRLGDCRGLALDLQFFGTLQTCISMFDKDLYIHCQGYIESIRCEQNWNAADRPTHQDASRAALSVSCYSLHPPQFRACPFSDLELNILPRVILILPIVVLGVFFKVLFVYSASPLALRLFIVFGFIKLLSMSIMSNIVKAVAFEGFFVSEP